MRRTFHDRSAPAPDEAADVIVPPPTGRWRRVLPLLGLAWVTFQASVPARYYRADADPHDERFAWRMFSATRVQPCAVDVVELDAGGVRSIDLATVLPAPWVSLVERNRAAVVQRFLAWRCEHGGIGAVQSSRHCRDADGAWQLESETRIDCATGEPG